MADAAACGHDHGHHAHVTEAEGVAAAPPEEQGLKGAVEALRLVQERRNETFFLFERGFQEILTGKSDFVGYRDLCHEVTEAFSALSVDIAAVRDSFIALDRADLVELVGRIQAFEKERLALVAQSQIERQPKPRPSAAPTAPSPEAAGAAAEVADAGAAASTAPPREASASASTSTPVGAPPPASCADIAEDAGEETLTDGGGRSDEIRREFLAVCQHLADCVDELKYEELD
eukprot:m.127760 g.127760  ORF g.127760 m.127760 type:complete len:233 (+) comp22255_c0_seq1:50-748(+)